MPSKNKKTQSKAKAVAQSDVTIATTSITFGKFVELADLENIKDFLAIAASTPEGHNLERLWDRAFEEGHTAGRQALLGNFNQKVRESYERGFDEGEAAG